MNKEAEVVETELLPCPNGTPICKIHGPGYEVYCTICADEKVTSTPADDPRVERLTAQLQGVMNCLAHSQQEVERLRTSADYIRTQALEEAAKVAREHKYLSEDCKHWLTTACFQIEDKIRALIPSTSISQPAVCTWALDEGVGDGDIWETSCGQAWTFTDGGPKDNRAIYCMHCGKPLEEVRPPLTQEEDE